MIFLYSFITYIKKWLFWLVSKVVIGAAIYLGLLSRSDEKKKLIFE